MKRAWVFVLAFGVLGAGAVGCKKSKKAPAGPAPGASAPATPKGASTGDTRRVDVTVGDTGFEPASIPAKVGEKLTLVFTRRTTSPCGGEVVLKSTGEKKELPLNEPVELAVVVDKAGSVDFACGMDMMQGSVVVQ